MVILWFCRSPVCFFKAIIVKGVLFRGGYSKGTSFHAFFTGRVVYRIFSPELKDVVAWSINGESKAVVSREAANFAEARHLLSGIKLAEAVGEYCQLGADGRKSTSL